MLPEDRPVEQAERQEFWEEIKFLRELQLFGSHTNIIGFVGYVVANTMLMVTEFAARGSLLGYLRGVAKNKAVNALPETLVSFCSHTVGLPTSHPSSPMPPASTVRPVPCQRPSRPPGVLGGACVQLCRPPMPLSTCQKEHRPKGRDDDTSPGGNCVAWKAGH